MLLGYWPKLAGIFVLLLIATVLELVRPYLIGRIVDVVASGGGWWRLVWILAGFLVAVVGRSGVILVRNYLMQQTGMRITCDMRITIFRHLQSLSLRFYDARHTGKIVSRISTDTGAFYSLVTGASVNLIGDVVMVGGVMILLLSANWKLAVLTYAILPLFIANYRWHRRRLRVESRRHRQNWDKVMSFLHERISSTRLVRAFAMEGVEVENFQKRIEADFRNFNRITWRTTLLTVGADLISGLGVFLVLAYGSWLVMQAGSTFTVGQLTAFLFYLGLLYAPIIRIVDSNAVMQQAATSLEKIFTLLDTQPHIPENDALPAMAGVEGTVAFEDVSFA